MEERLYYQTTYSRPKTSNEYHMMAVFLLHNLKTIFMFISRFERKCGTSEPLQAYLLVT